MDGAAFPAFQALVHLHSIYICTSATCSPIYVHASAPAYPHVAQIDARDTTRLPQYHTMYSFHSCMRIKIDATSLCEILITMLIFFQTIFIVIQR